ncbi:hypothetical protein K402DRAFT_401814 [Aulographum hederae CBS 113979]|uniref:C2H2-type domain-containing protein n=1 Tax=Aulographum hederae CBS 113979 TaxID=1176131 RepID=A0A6G1H9H4_9PEZI|nr:hypothetical protein K402DRAFT_401814 [Aulographum hederae CBS 113979]
MYLALNPTGALPLQPPVARLAPQPHIALQRVPLTPPQPGHSTTSRRTHSCMAGSLERWNNADKNWFSREESNGRASAEVYDRRRSPGPYDRRMPRNNRGRSRSPVAIDRYQPGRERDNHYRTREDAGPRRRSSPHPLQPGIDRYVPGQEPTQPVITTNPLPNPLTLDYQVGFNWFAEWWRLDQAIKEEKEKVKNGGRKPERVKGERESREERAKEREQIQAAYDTYKEKLQVQMARSFVHQHKGEEWFRERYDPVVRAPFRDRLNDFRKGPLKQWEEDLVAGVFDEFTLEGIYKNESNGAGGVLEKEEGETTAANEVLGVGDLLPTRGGELRDEAALQPTLLIKTIAPNINREKMENFCKENLGEGPGGFRWLSLSDPNPLKKCHRIGWVILNPGGDEELPPPVEDRGDGRDEEGEEIELKPEPSAPVTGVQKALTELNGKTIHDEERGDFTCHVGIHETPTAPRKKALWDLFSAPERIARDLELATSLVQLYDSELGEGADGLGKIRERVEEIRSKGWLQPPVNAPTATKVKKDEDEELEEGEDVNMDDEEEEGAYDEEVDDEELLVQKKVLDLLVEYLRRVYNFCFFCVFESDSVHELVRKCPGGHLRRPRASLTSAAKAAAKASVNNEPFPQKKQEPPADPDAPESPVEEKKQFGTRSKTQQQLQRAFNWVKTYEDKLGQILEPDNADIKKLGGKPFEEGLKEELKKYVKQEDESKFRCKVPECTKLFKGENFWEKHVQKRHDEFYAKVQQDVRLVNAYVLDPAHIAPSRSDANSNGHFPTSSHMQSGTPRGFNLANIPMMSGMPGMTGQLPNAAQFSQYFAQGMAPPMGFAMGFPGGDDDRHSGGPRRNMGRMNSNRMAGPYDRQSRDSRNNRWNNTANAGRLTPPRAGGRPGGRFPDAGGAGSVAPREAVTGRSIKSYEDLDAAGGSGTGELDY